MSLKADMDRANANDLPDAFRIIKLGQTLMQDVKQTLRRYNIHVTSGVNVYDDPTLDALVLPDDCKAGRLLHARTYASGVAVQEYTLDANDTVPITLHAAIQPTGNIAVLAADAITSIDLEFMPARGDMLEVTLPAVAGVITLPVAFTTRGVIYACEVQATQIGAGGLLGTKQVLAPGAGAPAAGQCRLNLAKTTITFAGADLVQAARVKCYVAAASDLYALLQSSAQPLI